MIILYTYIFWLLYLAVMSLYRGYLNKTLSRFGLILGAPIIMIGLVVDFIMNMTVFTLVFLERPQELLVTKRLQRHMKRSGWRYKLANHICNHLLNFADPTGNHCD